MAKIPEYNLDLVHADPQITAEQALENSQQRVTAAANEARQTPRRSVHVVVWTPEEVAAMEAAHGSGVALALYHAARGQLQNAGYRNETLRAPWAISITAGLASHLE